MWESLSFADIHTQTCQVDINYTEIWEATQHLTTGFTKIFQFSSHFNITSTTDEHIVLFELSLSRLFNMYWYVFGRLLSSKHIKMHKFTLFLIYI